MSSETTQAVMEHHLQAFVDNDLDGIMSDYADDAVMFTPDGAVHGKDAIREVFVGLFQVFPAGNSTIDLKQFQVDGEYAYILWSGEGPGHELPVGTDTYRVVDGQFVMQSFAAMVTEK